MKQHLIRFLKVGIMGACIYIGAITAPGFKDTWIDIIKGMGVNVITSEDVAGAYILPIAVMCCFGWIICKMIED